MRKLHGDRVRSLSRVGVPAAALRPGRPPFDDRRSTSSCSSTAIGPKTFFTVDNADVADKKQLAIDALVTYMTKPFTVYNDRRRERTRRSSATERTKVVESLTAAQLTGRVRHHRQAPARREPAAHVRAAAATGSMPTTGIGIARRPAGDRARRSARRGQVPAVQRNDELRIAGIGGSRCRPSFGSDGSQVHRRQPADAARPDRARRGRTAKLSLGANAGFILRKPRTIYDEHDRPAADVRASARRSRSPNRFSIDRRDLRPRRPRSSFALDESPIEADGGLRLIRDQRASRSCSAAAPASIKAIGSPQCAVLPLGRLRARRARQRRRRHPERDATSARSIPEDKDGFQDDDGCPDDDNDGDGVPDADDKCPNEAEDLDGFEDDDGCPELDNDKRRHPRRQGQVPERRRGRQAAVARTTAARANKRDTDGDGIPDASRQVPERARGQGRLRGRRRLPRPRQRRRRHPRRGRQVPAVPRGQGRLRGRRRLPRARQRQRRRPRRAGQVPERARDDQRLQGRRRLPRHRRRRAREARRRSPRASARSRRWTRKGLTQAGDDHRRSDGAA